MTTLKVSSPAELISAVPFLIGFHPADSLTVVAMHGPLVTFAVRIDLPERGTPEDEARASVLHLATVVLRQQAEAVTIIGYGEEARVTPAVLRASDAFRKAGVTIVDELHVEDGRYWSYLCTDLRCCPPEGRPCEPADSVVAAEATFAGAVALPNREALSAQLAPVTGDDREAMTAATARALLRLAVLAGKQPPPPEAAAGQPAGDPGAGGDQPAGDSPPAGEGAAQSGAGFVPHSRPAEQRCGNTAEPVRFHEAEPSRDAGVSREARAPRIGAAASVLSRPGSAELRLGNVLWASLGLAVPVPGESGPAPDESGPVPGESEPADVGADQVSAEDYFLALVQSAGRAAVREAERCYGTGGRLTDDAAAWLGVLLLHVPVRDYAWTRSRTREWELALWSDLVRRVEPRYLPAPAGLLAFVAWRMGMGPLASVAVERALDQKPDYTLGVLMQTAIMTGLPPSALDGWPTLERVPATGGCPGPGGEGAETDPHVRYERPRGFEPDPAPASGRTDQAARQPAGQDRPRPDPYAPAEQDQAEPGAREKRREGVRPAERDRAELVVQEKAREGARPAEPRSRATERTERPDKREKRRQQPRRIAHRRI